MTADYVPSARALAAVRPLLRTLASARQVYALYPAGHPNRDTTIREVFEGIRRLIDAQDAVPVIFAARSSFYLGTSLLAKESLSLFKLIETFEHAGIEALEVLPETSEEDVNTLILALHGEHSVTERLGGFVINRVKPTLSGHEERQHRLAELRRAYSSGLDVLRDSAVRVAAGEPVDLDEATSVVESIADKVISDPSHALLLTTVKSYDEYTFYHMVNVCMLSVALAHAIGLHRDQIVTLGIGALLHDVGKVHMPEDVLFHVGKLSEEQWRIVQKHPVDGAGLIFSTREGLYHPAASVVLEHHSGFELGGYPSLHHRHNPSVPARLVSVADCFDAVTSKRSYRAPAERREALHILDAGSGKGFDPRFVRIFVRLLGLFPVGSLVELDNGEVGLVVDNAEGELARPTVMMVMDADGNPVSDGEERDLSARGGDGEHLWGVRRSIDPADFGVDVMQLLTTGDLDEAREVVQEEPTGLVHEPSHGEDLPDDYVDTHAHGHSHDHIDGEVDPDVAPPFAGE